MGRGYWMTLWPEKFPSRDLAMHGVWRAPIDALVGLLPPRDQTLDPHCPTMLANEIASVSIVALDVESTRACCANVRAWTGQTSGTRIQAHPFFSCVCTRRRSCIGSLDRSSSHNRYMVG